jgi:hypothetical protein
VEQPPLLVENASCDICHHPGLVAALAIALAVVTDWEWFSRRTLRVLRFAACCCGRPLSTLLSHTHSTAAAMSRFVSGQHPGIPTPGARLLCHWREGGHPVAGAVSDPRIIDPHRLTHFLQQLRQPAQLRGPRDALALATTALTEGVGLQRAAVLHHSPGSGTLQTLFNAGFDATEPLRLPVDAHPLLGRLLAKPLCLVVGPDNRERLLPHLPAPLRSVGSLLLMAVFAGRAPLALIHADNAGSVIEAAQVEQFKQLCQQLSATLGGLVRRQTGAG